MTIAAEDISSRFTNLNNHPRFTIYAGGSDLPRVMLTVPNAMTGPSSTPSGSATIEDISQGSVSLQNFPEKGDTTNSFDSLHGPEAAVVQPDAITITAITPADKDAKYVEGTFHVKTFGLGHPGDAKITDHLVQGRFRIMFAYDPGQGF